LIKIIRTTVLRSIMVEWCRVSDRRHWV